MSAVPDIGPQVAAMTGRRERAVQITAVEQDARTCSVDVQVGVLDRDRTADRAV
jgi:hypothetical protein